MKYTAINDIKVYDLTIGRSLPEWLSQRKRRSLLKKDFELRHRIELLQDFGMPCVTSAVTMSPDGKYIITSGTYKPRIRCYDVDQLSMKFERCVDIAVLKTLVISEDYSKMILLQDDRNIQFHNRGSLLTKLRIPTFCRDMAYHYPSCDLFIAGTGPDVYRLNLEQGRFLAPFSTSGDSVTTCEFNPEHELFTCTTSNGSVECWDVRVKNCVASLKCHFSSIISNDTQAPSSANPKITAFSYKNSLTYGVGLSTGHVLLFDLRSRAPYMVKDHNYGFPINTISFDTENNFVLSSDTKIVKIWNECDASPYAYIEPSSDVNSFYHIKRTGLLFVACESPKTGVYFIPSLGHAPTWCGFLDNLTEDMEESGDPLIYDDYKFVTKEDLEVLGLDNLIGSQLLHGYMHGYFIDVALYRKAQKLVDPFAYEKYRKERIQTKLEEARISRAQFEVEREKAGESQEISLPKINTELAHKLMRLSKNSEKKATSQKGLFSDVLDDERFSKLFSQKDYQIDKENEEYKQIQSTMNSLDKKLARAKQADENFAVEEDASNESNFDDDHEEKFSHASSDDTSSETSSSDSEYIIDSLRQKEKCHMKTI